MSSRVETLQQRLNSRADEKLRQDTRKTVELVNGFFYNCGQPRGDFLITERSLLFIEKEDGGKYLRVGQHVIGTLIQFLAESDTAKAAYRNEETKDFLADFDRNVAEFNALKEGMSPEDL